MQQLTSNTVHMLCDHNNLIKVTELKVLTLWMSMSTTVNVQCDAYKTKGWLKSSPRMCQLSHILVQLPGDT
jgi:hypothetical protein